MKRAIIICLMAGAIPCAWALDNAVINEWLGQQAWFDQCRKSVPFPQVGPRINKSLKECVDAGRSKDECEPLAMRANLLWINANTPHWVQCYENNLPPKIAACANKARIEDLECKLKLDTGERQRCAGPVIEKRYACLADHVKADIAKTPLIRDPLKVTLPSGITLHDWIVAARTRLDKPGEIQALLDESVAHIRTYGPHPDLVSIRDDAIYRSVKTLPLTNENQARAALPRLEALRKLVGNSSALMLPLGKANHLLGNFAQAREAYAALLQAMGPDAPLRKSVVDALGKIEKREKPSTGIEPPVALGTLRDCPECPEMVMISEGGFEMGAVGIAEPVHLVRVPSFALAKTEVTQAQWRAVMGNNPSHFKNCDDCPVETVGWDGIQEYLRRLSAKTGKVYRLPSEAEWEYACRAGGNHKFCGSNNLDDVAWYGAYEYSSGKSSQNTNPVARKRPNALGLYDMSGNVREWVEDCWHDSYAGAPDDGSARKECGNDVELIVRGGSYANGPMEAHSADRQKSLSFSWKGGDLNSGFRPARVLP